MAKDVMFVGGGEFKPLVKRKLTLDTCQRWGYEVGTAFNPKADEVQPCQIANFYQGSKLIAQKIRFPSKDFLFLRSKDGPKFPLYGAWLWRTSGKMVVVTEGEVDAMTVSQLQGHKWPVVSIPNGVKAAAKCFQENLEWLSSFDTVVIMFDMDEQGQGAAEECAQLLEPGKVKIASLSLKDPNEMLLAGRSKEVIDAIWNAKEYRPEGIVTMADLKDQIDKPPERGLSYPWETLTKLTYGIRPSELIALGAGTGLGKTEVFKEIIYHLVKEHQQKCGVFFLEEQPKDTAMALMSKHANKPLHIPGTPHTQAEKDAAFKTLDGWVYYFDHFGATEYENIKSRMRYLVVSLGVKHIFLDHITALTSGDMENDERKRIDFIMTDLASLVRELKFNIHFISHLNTPDGKPHEEGGRVMIRHFRGSRALGQWSSFMFGLERNQQAEDLAERHTTTFRLLKDRYTGQSTGETFSLVYNKDTGRLTELDDNPFAPNTAGLRESLDLNDIPF